MRSSQIMREIAHAVIFIIIILKYTLQKYKFIFIIDNFCLHFFILISKHHLSPHNSIQKTT